MSQTVETPIENAGNNSIFSGNRKLIFKVSVMFILSGVLFWILLEWLGFWLLTGYYKSNTRYVVTPCRIILQKAPFTLIWYSAKKDPVNALKFFKEDENEKRIPYYYQLTDHDDEKVREEAFERIEKLIKGWEGREKYYRKALKDRYMMILMDVIWQIKHDLKKYEPQIVACMSNGLKTDLLTAAIESPFRADDVINILRETLPRNEFENACILILKSVDRYEVESIAEDLFDYARYNTKKEKLGKVYESEFYVKISAFVEAKDLYTIQWVLEKPDVNRWYAFLLRRMKWISRFKVEHIFHGLFRGHYPQTSISSIAFGSEEMRKKTDYTIDQWYSFGRKKKYKDKDLNRSAWLYGLWGDNPDLMRNCKETLGMSQTEFLHPKDAVLLIEKKLYEYAKREEEINEFMAEMDREREKRKLEQLASEMGALYADQLCKMKWEESFEYISLFPFAGMYPEYYTGPAFNYVEATRIASEN